MNEHSHKGHSFPIQVLLEREIKSFFDAAGNTRVGIRNRAILTVLLRAQLRCFEALSIKDADFNEDDCSIVVARGKGGKRRVVGIDRASVNVVREWLEVRPAKSDFLFCTMAGGEMSTSYVRAMVRRLRARAGITKRVHPHGLRHTGASMLAEKGVDIRIIQKQLGHTSLTITDRYINHLNPRAVIEAIRDIQYGKPSPT